MLQVKSCGWYPLLFCLQPSSACSDHGRVSHRQPLKAPRSRIIILPHILQDQRSTCLNGEEDARRQRWTIAATVRWCVCVFNEGPLAAYLQGNSAGFKYVLSRCWFKLCDSKAPQSPWVALGTVLSPTCIKTAPDTNVLCNLPPKSTHFLQEKNKMNLYINYWE